MNRPTHPLGDQDSRAQPIIKPQYMAQSLIQPQYHLPTVSTGIRALDSILDGGFDPGSTWMLEAAPGVGKTLTALHFLYAGVVTNEPGLYITAGESPATLVHAIAQNWPPLESALSQRRLVILDPSPFFTEQRLSKERSLRGHISPWDDLARFIQDVAKQAKTLGAKRIVIDPLTPMMLATASSIDLWNCLQSLIATLELTVGATTMLTHTALPLPDFEAVGLTMRAVTTGVMRLERRQLPQGNTALVYRVVKRRHHLFPESEAICLVGAGGRISNSPTQYLDHAGRTA